LSPEFVAFSVAVIWDLVFDVCCAVGCHLELPVERNSFLLREINTCTVIATASRPWKALYAG